MFVEVPGICRRQRQHDTVAVAKSINAVTFFQSYWPRGSRRILRTRLGNETVLFDATAGLDEPIKPRRDPKFDYLP